MNENFENESLQVESLNATVVSQTQPGNTEKYGFLYTPFKDLFHLSHSTGFYLLDSVSCTFQSVPQRGTFQRIIKVTVTHVVPHIIIDSIHNNNTVERAYLYTGERGVASWKT